MIYLFQAYPQGKLPPRGLQILDALLNQHFAGRVVRKDLTKQLKEGANVPVYVLE
ncbi:anti-phage BREX system Lon protease BrxL [Escherichia coli]|uniref:anti-phage BREX system Lon protease BrxL n=1 Tax=Escherichia coli TaxID=562 RepID=UPI002FCCC022